MVDFYGINVGKYTVRPMDPMGMNSVRNLFLNMDICLMVVTWIFQNLLGMNETKSGNFTQALWIQVAALNALRVQFGG